jgi:hypothetical protein
MMHLIFEADNEANGKRWKFCQKKAYKENE